LLAALVTLAGCASAPPSVSVQVSEGQVKASSVELAPIVSDTSTDGSVAAAAAEIIDLAE